METTNSESVSRLELSLPISLRSLQTLDGEGRDDGAWRADGCAHVNTLVHSPDGEGCSASKRKTCHDITGQCRCRAGTGSESREAWWGRLCHAADRLWESGVNEGEVHLIAVLVGAHWLFEPLYINRPPSCHRFGITEKNSTQKIHFHVIFNSPGLRRKWNRVFESICMDGWMDGASVLTVTVWDLEKAY